MFPYWLAFPRMAGSFENEQKRKRESERQREKMCTRHSLGKEKNIYIRERRRRARTYSSSYCLDIGALIFTTMYQLPACYLHDVLTSLVSSRACPFLTESFHASLSCLEYECALADVIVESLFQSRRRSCCSFELATSNDHNCTHPADGSRQQ